MAQISEEPDIILTTKSRPTHNFEDDFDCITAPLKRPSLTEERSLINACLVKAVGRTTTYTFTYKDLMRRRRRQQGLRLLDKVSVIFFFRILQ